jgi:RND family efflux transporter MFP subunit
MRAFLIHVLLPILLVAGAGAGAWWMYQTTRKPPPPPPPAFLPLVRTLVLQPGDVAVTVHSQGNVVPRTETTLSAEVAGRVLRVADALRSGGWFDAGTELVAIDPTDHQLALQKALAEVARAERQLVWEQAEAESAVSEWRKLNPGEPPALVARVPQVAEAKALLLSAQAARDQAQRDVERAVVRAPYAGRVRERRVDVGDYLSRGTILARIYAIDAVEVRLPLPDAELAHLMLPPQWKSELPPEQSPAVTLRARFAGALHEWPGRIVRIEGEIDPRTRMVHVVARVDDPYGSNGPRQRPPLAPGLFVQAVIDGRTYRGVFAVPRAAMRDQDSLWVVDSQSHVHRLRLARVTVVHADQERVLVAAGLAPGCRICVSPLEAPVEGMQVRVEQPQEAGR